MTGRGSYRGNFRGRGTRGGYQGRGGYRPQQPRNPPNSRSNSNSRFTEKQNPLEQAILRAVETVMSTNREDFLSSRLSERSRSESSRRSYHSSRRSPSPQRRSQSSRHYSRDSRHSSQSPKRQRRHYDSPDGRSRDRRSRAPSPRTSRSRTRSPRLQSPDSFLELDLESISSQVGTRLVPVSETERRNLDPQNTGRQFVRMQPRGLPPPGSRQPYRGPDRRQVFNARSVPVHAERTAQRVRPFVDTRPSGQNQLPVEIRPSVEVRPSVENQPSVGNNSRREVSRSPERPSYIPPVLPPRRLPIQTNSPDYLRTFFLTNVEGLERIGIHSNQRIIGSIKHFMIDVRAYGYVVLYTDPLKSPIDTLTLCSPSGHVHIVQKGEKGVLLPKEINDLLFKDTVILKVALFSREIKLFQTLFGWFEINVVELYPVIKKNLREINIGVIDFLKYNLGPDVHSDRIDIQNDDHVRTVATYSRAIAYGVWLVAARLAKTAGLTSAANISGYMRFALFSESKDGYRQLLADPYYVPLDENYLSPLHQSELDAVLNKYQSVQRRTMRTIRPRFVKPFTPLLTDTQMNCLTCGVYVKPGT